jgi:hypothetical protein
MNRTSKGYTIGLVIALLFIAFLIYLFRESKYKVDGIGDKFSSQKEAEAIATDNGACGLIVSTPLSKTTVAFPLTVKTVVDNTQMDILGCAWSVFEAQAGFVEVIDGDGNVVGGGTLTTDEDWMTTGPVRYDAELKLTKTPSTKTLDLVFTEENPSGEGIPDTFVLPVKTI